MRIGETITGEQYRREQIREARVGKKSSPETIALISAGCRKFNQEHPEVRKRAGVKISAALTGRKLSPEHKAKIGDGNRGKVHTPETRKKRSVSCRKFNQEHPEVRKRAGAKVSAGLLKFYKENPEARKKIGIGVSKTRSRKILSGELHPSHHGISGYFYSKKNQKKLHYRSKLELAWYKVLEQLSKVVRYEVEPVAIPYSWKDSVHLYHPDLMVVYTDHTLELVEIRPEGVWCRGEQEEAKFEAARRWCAGPGRRIVFRTWGYNELKVERT